MRYAPFEAQRGREGGGNVIDGADSTWPMLFQGPTRSDRRVADAQPIPVRLRRLPTGVRVGRMLPGERD